MLRINVEHPAERAALLKLEGKLIEDWVEEAAKTWNEVAASRESAIVNLDSVSYIDSQGRCLLNKMNVEGAKLIGSGPLIRGVIGEIEACSIPNRARQQGDRT
jgi:hypothetical protein